MTHQPDYASEGNGTLMPSKRLIAGGICLAAGLAWFLLSPGEVRSANPFNRNYDASLNNSGPKLKKRYVIVTDTVDANGVSHQSEQPIN